MEFLSENSSSTYIGLSSSSREFLRALLSSTLLAPSGAVRVSHYEDLIGHKKKMYAKVIAVYSPDVDAVYMVCVDYDVMHDVRMAEGILDRIADSGFF